MCFFQFFRSDPRDLTNQCLIGFFTVQYLTDQPFGRIQISLSKKHLTIQLFIRHFPILFIQSCQAISYRICAHRQNR